MVCVGGRNGFACVCVCVWDEERELKKRICSAFAGVCANVCLSDRMQMNGTVCEGENSYVCSRNPLHSP